MKQIDRNKGFTLIELALVVLILAILASVAIPSYQDYVEKARLAELQLRVDAMRTAMASAYETGERSMLTMGAGAPGQIPDTLIRVPIEDSMSFPGLQLVLMASSKQFQQFTPEPRPYLVLAADGAEGHRTLRNFSEIYPNSNWAWWVPSSIMVIPLLEASRQVTQTPASTAGAATQVAAPAGGTGVATDITPGNTSPDTSAGTQNPVDQSSTSNPLPGSNTNPDRGTANSAFNNQVTVCVHPGNGHAFGHCKNN